MNDDVKLKLIIYSGLTVFAIIVSIIMIKISTFLYIVFMFCVFFLKKES